MPEQKCGICKCAVPLEGETYWNNDDGFAHECRCTIIHKNLTISTEDGKQCPLFERREE